MQSIFITGASGCVGHYVLERLAYPPASSCAPEPRYHLYALVRDRRKLQLANLDEGGVTPSGSRITILEGNLLNIQDFAPILAQMDGLIHVAAAWGDAKNAYAINVTKTLELFDLLNPDRCQKILYFSTASLLNEQNRPLEIAGRSGTAYIRSKYEMLMHLDQVALRDRMITLYPTLLFGGSPHHPYSHITAGLKDVIRWLNLLRFLRLDASFHFVHAEDIAEIVAYVLREIDPPTDLVLGNPPITFNQCVEQVAAYYRKRIYFRVPFPIRLARSLAFLFRVRLSEWDDYCIQHRHFVYQSVNTQTFDLPSQFLTVADLLNAYM